MPAKESWGLPKHAKEIWDAAYSAAIEEYNGDEGKASATAWAAVKTKYEKKGDKWMLKAGVKESRLTVWVPILESETPDTETGLIRGAMLIRAGYGAGGQRFYPAETLQAALPLYDGVKMFTGHGTVEERNGKKERDIEDWIGNIVPGSVKWDETRTGIMADIQMIKGNPHAVALLEMAKDPLVRRGIGLSHRAYAVQDRKVVDGKTTAVVEAIKSVDSVDFVTEAGAGGQIAQAVIESEVKNIMGETIRDLHDLEVEHSDLLLEHKQVVEAPLAKEIAEKTDRIRALEGQVASYEKRDKVRAYLTSAGVPDKGMALVLEGLIARPHVDDTALKADCEGAAKQIAELLHEAKPRAVGVGPSVTPEIGGDADALKALDSMGKVVSAAFGHN